MNEHDINPAAGAGSDGDNSNQRLLIRNAALSLTKASNGTASTGSDRVDLFIEHGVIRRVATGGSIDPTAITRCAADDPVSSHGRDGQEPVESMSSPAASEIIEAEGLIALPGFTDLYGRLREPGPGGRGTLASESQAALAAGFTRVLCSPDTQPPIDNTATLELILRRAAAARGARVLPIAALTQGLEGRQLGELATLQAGGCVAASHADVLLADTGVLYSAMQYARTFDLPLIMVARDAHLGAAGCVNQGAMATRLGLPGIPVAAETVALGRLLELARESGCRLHVSRVSSGRAVELIAEARQDGLAVTADVGIHHLFFTDDDLAGYDARYLSAVPFRSRADRAALRRGVAEGIIDAICSDHAPQDTDASLAPFAACAAGLSAYDHFLPLLLALLRVSDMTPERLLDAVITAPSRVIDGDDAARSVQLAEGARADLVLVDPAGDGGRQADADHFEGLSPATTIEQKSASHDSRAAVDNNEDAPHQSAGRNSPLFGEDVIDEDGVALELCGRVALAVVGGVVRPG